MSMKLQTIFFLFLLLVGVITFFVLLGMHEFKREDRLRNMQELHALSTEPAVQSKIIEMLRTNGPYNLDGRDPKQQEFLLRHCLQHGCTPPPKPQ